VAAPLRGTGSTRGRARALTGAPVCGVRKLPEGGRGDTGGGFCDAQGTLSLDGRVIIYR